MFHILERATSSLLEHGNITEKAQTLLFHIVTVHQFIVKNVIIAYNICWISFIGQEKVTQIFS